MSKLKRAFMACVIGTSLALAGPSVAGADPGTTGSITGYLGLAGGASQYVSVPVVAADRHTGVGGTTLRAPGKVDTPTVTTVGTRTATIKWTVPKYVGSKITSYDVQVSGGGTTGLHPVGGGATQYRATGLNNDNVYSLRVRAINSKGAGPFSNVVKAESFGTPAPLAAPVITAGELTKPGSTVVPQITWSRESDPNGGPVTTYTVYRRAEGSRASTEVCSVSGSAALTCSAPTSTNNGARYQFAVTATNSSLPAGLGSAESPTVHWVSFTANGVPNQIGDVKAFASQTAFASGTPDPGPQAGSGAGYNGALKVRFTVPQANGPAVSSVQYSVNSGSSWQDLAASTLRQGATATGTISGLTNGSGYQVELRAYNGTNYGPPSAATAAEYPYTTPTPPTLSAAERFGQDRSLTYTWGGSGTSGRAVAMYYISIDGAAQSVGPSPGSATVSGVALGIRTVAAYAIDTAGQRSRTVTQKVDMQPPAPGGVSCSANGTTIHCWWDYPSGVHCGGFQWSWDNTSNWSPPLVGCNGNLSTSRNFGFNQTHTFYVRGTDGDGHHSDPLRASATTAGPPTTGTGAPTVTVSKGANCAFGGWSAYCSQGSTECGYCAYIHVTLTGFPGSVTCSFNSSLGSSGFVNESFPGTADQDSSNFFGGSGWVQATCGGTVSNQFTWP